MHRSPPRTRRAQTCAYVLFAVAGCTSLVVPSPSVQEASGSQPLFWVWVVFLIVGGLIAATGRAMGRWVGEFVGLPLLGAAFMIYALSLIFTTITSGRWTGLTAGFTLAAIFFLVGARWAEVNAVRVEAIAEARARRGIHEPEEVPTWRHRRTPKGG